VKQLDAKIISKMQTNRRKSSDKNSTELYIRVYWLVGKGLYTARKLRGGMHPTFKLKSNKKQAFNILIKDK